MSTLFRGITTAICLQAITFPASAAEPQSAFPLALQVPATENGNVFYISEEKSVLARITNHSGQARTGELNVTITTDDGRELKSAHPVEIAPSAQVELPLTLDLPGACFAEATFGLGELAAPFRTTYAVVRPPAVATLPLDQSFYGVCNMAVGVAAARRVGVRFVRYASVFWRWTNPQEGKYKFTGAISFGEECRDAGVGVIYTFHPNPPAWTGIPHMVLAAEPEHLPKFEEWVRTALRALPPGDRAVEFINEPDLDIGRSNLANLEQGTAATATLQRLGYDLVKEFDPTIPVLGIDVSGEDARTAVFARPALEKSAGKIDYYSMHPYVGGRNIVPDGSVVWPDEYLAPVLETSTKLAREFTTQKKVWSTELGWAYPMHDLYLSDSTRTYAAITAQALVLMKTVPGIEKVAWFRGYQYKEGLNERGHDYSLFLQAPGGMRPTPGVSAFATVSSLLEGARTGKKLDLGPALHCYLFENPLSGQALAALWTTRFDVSPKSPLPPGMTTVDHYGREVSTENVAKWLLTRAPSFLLTNQDQLGALKTWLEQAEWQPEQPFVVTQIGATAAGTLNVAVESLLMEDTEAEISALGSNTTQTLRPGENRVALPLPAGLFAKARLEASLKVAGAGTSVGALLDRKLLQVPYHPPGAIALDGVITPRKKALASHHATERANIFPLDPAVQWAGADDLAFQYGYSWSEEGLYLLCIARDDRHYGLSEGIAPWKYDSLQLALDPKIDTGGSGYQPGDRELTVFLTSAGESGVAQSYPPSSHSPDLLAKVTRAGQDTIYEVLLPWTYLLGAGREAKADLVLAANFIINDNDGGERKYWMGEVDGIGSGKQPSAFPWLVLQPPVQR